MRKKRFGIELLLVLLKAVRDHPDRAPTRLMQYTRLNCTTAFPLIERLNHAGFITYERNIAGRMRNLRVTEKARKWMVLAETVLAACKEVLE
jgi:predicted transcriptional regulator